MTQFIRIGKTIININAIAKVEIANSADSLQADVYLVNGEYVVLVGEQARKFLDFFDDRGMEETGTPKVPEEVLANAYICGDKAGFDCTEY